MSIRICENGVYRDATEAEIARMEAEKPELPPEEAGEELTAEEALAIITGGAV